MSHMNEVIVIVLDNISVGEISRTVKACEKMNLMLYSSSYNIFPASLIQQQLTC